MTRTLSLCLDVIRFTAALLVFLHHASFRQFGTHLPWRLALTGTEPVMVFFVLSGFVIAYTAETKDHSFREYWISRFSRILSVSLAAIALTLVLDLVGRTLDPGLYEMYPRDPVTLTNIASPLWLRLLTTATFTNEIWWLDLWPGTNSPFWSLGYEVAYYAIFSIAFYLRGILRIGLLAVSVVVTGPKILLLLPVWLLGVLGWRVVKSVTISPATGSVMIAISLLAYVLFISTGTPRLLAQLFLAFAGIDHSFGLAAYWMGDLVTGLLFTGCLVGFAGVQKRFEPLLQHWARPIRLLASMTFSLYLLHYPLIHVLAAICRSTGFATVAPVIVLGGTLAITFLISRVTEIRKDAWRPWLAMLLDPHQSGEWHTGAGSNR